MAQVQAKQCSAFFHQEFPSTLEAMREVVTSALQCLEAHDCLCGERRFFARLCLEEALVNAIRHGNKGNRNLNVVLEMLDEGETCRIVVRDQGPGFCPEQIQKPAPESCGGRGVFLIKSFMRQVTFNRDNGGLEMVLSKNPTEGNKNK